MQNLKSENQMPREFIEEEEKPIDWLGYLEVVLQNWRLVAYLTIGITVLSILVSLILPKSYLASATILPSKDSGGAISRLGQLSGLVGGLGLDMLGGDNPTVTYPRIVQSKNILYDLAKEEFYSNEFPQKAPLYKILDVDGDSLPEILEKTEKLLKGGVITVDLDRKTDILTISAMGPEPQLTADIANSLVEKLNKFNIEVRTKKAKENRIFIEKRLEEAKKDLARAEDELKRFREQNRKVESPDLLLQQGRLIREVTIQETIFLTLAKEYELAKVSEVKDTPVISILDKAVAPTKKEKPKRRVIVMVSFLLGFFFSLAFVFVKNTYDQQFASWSASIQQPSVRKLLLNFDRWMKRITQK